MLQLYHITQNMHIPAGSADGQRRELQPPKSPHQPCCWYRQADDSPSTKGFKHLSPHSLIRVRGLDTLATKYYFSIYIFLLWVCKLLAAMCWAQLCKLSEGPVGAAEGREILSKAQQRCCGQPWMTQRDVCHLLSQCCITDLA